MLTDRKDPAVIKTESDFRAFARNAIVDYWNANRTLSKRWGKIIPSDVYVVWQVKALQNFKALLAVNRDGDGMYFEVTYDGDKGAAYLDAYRKAANKELKFSIQNKACGDVKIASEDSGAEVLAVKC